MTAKYEIDQELVAKPFRYAVWSIIVLMFIAILWASFSKLDIVSHANGEIAPSSSVKKIQHLEGGIILQIPIEEGQQLKQGDPILVLEPIKSQAEVEIVRQKYLGLKADEARLQAEISGARFVTFPDELTAKHANLLKPNATIWTARFWYLKHA